MGSRVRFIYLSLHPVAKRFVDILSSRCDSPMDLPGPFDPAALFYPMVTTESLECEAFNFNF
jgi:hypothetical protein